VTHFSIRMEVTIQCTNDSMDGNTKIFY